MGASRYACKFCGEGNVAVRGDDDYSDCYWACGKCPSSRSPREVEQDEIDELNEDIKYLQNELVSKNAVIANLANRIKQLEMSGPINVITHENLQTKCNKALANCKAYASNINKLTAMLTSGIQQL